MQTHNKQVHTSSVRKIKNESCKIDALHPKTTKPYFILFNVFETMTIGLCTPEFFIVAGRATT